MKASLAILCLLALTGLSPAQLYVPESDAPSSSGVAKVASAAATTTLTKITDVRMNAVTASLDTSTTTPSFIFSNVRAVSKTTTLMDLIRARYPVSKTSLDLLSAKVEIFKDIGIFDEINALFMKNVPAIAAMKQGTSTIAYESDYFHTFKNVNDTKPFVFDFQAGQSIGFCFNSLSTPCYAAMTRSATAPKATEYTGLLASNFYQDRLAILTPGKYYLWLKPQTGSVATVRFAFFNENASTLGTLVNKSTLGGNLRGSVRDYLKWKIRLVANQDLVITQTGGSDVQWRVIGDDSAEVGNFFKGGDGTLVFSPLVNAPRTGDYYLVASKSAFATDISVRATVTVAP